MGALISNLTLTFTFLICIKTLLFLLCFVIWSLMGVWDPFIFISKNSIGM